MGRIVKLRVSRIHLSGLTLARPFLARTKNFGILVLGIFLE